MPMRVIAGEYRHRKLTYPESNPNIRPTKDRIREAFFSSLGDISNKVFLDLYAGCGSMGIEAVSRGASKAYFIDYSDEAIRYVKENIKSLGIEDKCVVNKSNDLLALNNFANSGIKFDIIYLDPPYEYEHYEEVISKIIQFDLIKPNGVIAFEANKHIEINPLWNKRIKEYHYGEITVTTLK